MPPRSSRARPAIASSTSASPGTPSVSTTLSSNGLRTSKLLSPVRHSPFTRNGLISVISEARSSWSRTDPGARGAVPLLGLR